MSKEEEKIANENLKRIRPQSVCKPWKTKKFGKNEYWTPNSLLRENIETTDMETEFIEEEFQGGEEE